MIGGGALKGMNDAIKNNKKIRSKRKNFSGQNAKSSGLSQGQKFSKKAKKAFQARARKNRVNTKMKVRFIMVLSLIVIVGFLYFTLNIFFG